LSRNRRIRLEQDAGRCDSHFFVAREKRAVWDRGRVMADGLRDNPFWRWNVISKDHQINDEIRAKEVRLVGAAGEQIGIKPFREALQMAIDANLDLVNVAPQAKPPVCRIMDYGKFRYEQQKKEKEARKNQKIVDLKEVWFRSNIEEHDYQTKFRNVVKFLGEGDKVKCSVRFRGREIAHSNIGQKILERVAKEVADICVVERMPKLEGRSMIMILAPKSH
jgi:translation initiation factor IF-3